MTNGDAAAALGKDGEPGNGDSNRDFLVARNGSRDDSLAELALQVQDGASVILAAGSTASARKAGSRRLAAELHVEATQSDLAAASQAIGILVKAAVSTAKGAAEAVMVSRVEWKRDS